MYSLPAKLLAVVTFVVVAASGSVFGGRQFNIARERIQSGMQTRDSAGVRIVEHATIKNAPVAFAITATPRLAFGGLQSDSLLEFVPGPSMNIHRFSDGRIAIEDHYHIKIFDAQGKFRSVVGRQGQGPGEFYHVSTACIARGDTLIVFSNGVGRVTIFSQSGVHVRTIPRGGDGAVPNGVCFADGSYLLPGLRPEIDRSNGQEWRVVRRVNLDGTPAATIASFSQPPAVLVPPSLQLTVHDTLVFSSDEGRTAYRVYSRNGRLMSIVRWQDPAEQINDKTPLPARLTAAGRGTARVGRAAAPASGGAETIPAYGYIRVDNSGRVWLSNHPYSVSGPGWVVFSATGALLGRVAMPSFVPEANAAATLMGFDGNDAVFQWRDKSDGALRLTSHPIAASR